MEKAFDNCIQNQYSCIAMNRVILQVPMSKELKEEAQKASSDLGFSSLQETIRVLLSKLSKRELTLTVQEERVVKLSPKAEKRYAKIEKDMKEGKNVYHASDVDDLIRQLESA